MNAEFIEQYGNRLRVRVCGMCWKDDKLLVINHKMGPSDNFWAPVGGGVEFGESILNALAREFREEANILIKPGRFLFACEYIEKPLHAVELFFEVFHESGSISLGNDPESQTGHQVLKEIRFMEIVELVALNHDERHGIFRLAGNAEELKKLTGFYII